MKLAKNDAFEATLLPVFVECVEDEKVADFGRIPSFERLLLREGGESSLSEDLDDFPFSFLTFFFRLRKDASLRKKIRGIKE